VALGLEQLRRDGLALAADWGGALIDFPPNDEYRNFAFPTDTDELVNLSVPLPIYDAFLFAVGGFPRRGDYYSPFEIAYDFQAINRLGEALDSANFDFDKAGSLPNTLRFAVDVLGTTLSTDVRLAIAGELTLSWASDQAPMLAGLIWRMVYAVFADEVGGTLPMAKHVPGVKLSDLLLGNAQLIYSTKSPVEEETT
jgi:hypothetical protein